jgi:hypothetical protein
MRLAMKINQLMALGPCGAVITSVATALNGHRDQFTADMGVALLVPRRRGEP